MRTDRKLRKMLMDISAFNIYNYNKKDMNKLMKYIRMIKHTKSKRKINKYINILKKIYCRELMREFNKLSEKEKILLFKYFDSLSEKARKDRNVKFYKYDYVIPKYNKKGILNENR